MTDTFVLDVLKVFEVDHCDELLWHVDGDTVTFTILCNDFFYWGCADGERVTPDNLPALRQAFADTAAATRHGDCWAGPLFCARQRGMRPQGAQYKHIDTDLWPLFDACGPAREVGLGNPRKHPSEVTE